MTAFIFLLHGSFMAVALLVLASLIDISRMYLGHHYPTDILGGFILSLFIIKISDMIIVLF